MLFLTTYLSKYIFLHGSLAYNLKSTAILMLAVLLIGEQLKNILPKNISALNTLCRSCDIFHSSSIVDRVVVDELQDLLDVVVHDVIGKREKDGPLFLLEEEK